MEGGVGSVAKGLWGFGGVGEHEGGLDHRSRTQGKSGRRLGDVLIIMDFYGVDDGVGRCGSWVGASKPRHSPRHELQLPH